jgi:hypothetical protein
MPDRCTRGQASVSRTENLSVGNDNGDRTSLLASPRSRAAVEVSCECSGSVSGRCQLGVGDLTHRRAGLTIEGVRQCRLTY